MLRFGHRRGHTIMMKKVVLTIFSWQLQQEYASTVFQCMMVHKTRRKIENFICKTKIAQDIQNNSTQKEPCQNSNNFPSLQVQLLPTFMSISFDCLFMADKLRSPCVFDLLIVSRDVAIAIL